jgi:hypothetical protein
MNWRTPDCCPPKTPHEGGGCPRNPTYRTDRSIGHGPDTQRESPKVRGIGCREWAPKLAPSPLSMRVVAWEGGRRPSRRLNDAPHSGAQRGMRRARWPASRRKETSSFTNSILLPTVLYFIPSVITEESLHRRRDPSSQLQPLV